MHIKERLTISGMGLHSAPPRRLDRPGKQERDPIVHVLFALLAGAVSLVVTAFILWPGSPIDHLGAPLVFASEPTPQGIATESKHNSTASRAVIAGAPREEFSPPTALADEEGPLSTLVCTVVDEFWRPIADAEVWINDGEWQRAGRCDARGSFDLRFDLISWEKRFEKGDEIRIGARAAKHRPSLVTTLTTKPSADLRFVLRGSGASLRLEVAEPGGLPIADALITFLVPEDPDSPNSLAVLVSTDERVEPTPTPSARSDFWGTVVFEGLEPGRREFSVAADGYRTRTEFVTLTSGEPQVHHVELVPQAGLRGIALGPGGRPLPNTNVFVLGDDDDSEFTTTCDDKGQFEMLDLAAGSVRLVAEARTEGILTHYAYGQQVLLPGQTGEWNPILRPTLLLTGRLLDSNGQPLTDWRVELLDEGDLAGESATDEDGRYELPASARLSTNRIAFFHPNAQGGIPSYTFDIDDHNSQVLSVELGEGEDSASPMRGRVLGPGGSPPTYNPVVIQRLTDNASVTILPDSATGMFESPALPPGIYTVRFPLHGRGWALDQRIVVDGRLPIDLGTISMPATGRLSLLPPNSNQRVFSTVLQIELLRPGVDSNYGLPVLLSLVEIPIQLDLSPGHYHLRETNWPDRRWVEFTVESLQTTDFVIPGS